MSLSIEKLTEICEMNGLVPLNYFRMKRSLLFVQTISLKQGYSFMINIPKKFNFDVKSERIGNIYKIKKLKINKDNLNQPYKSPDNHELDTLYSEIELQKKFDPDVNTAELESKLLESYKKKIYLSSLDKEEFQQIKDIFRQIQRLKFCVQGIDYKISIIFKNYLCSLDENDDIECYYIKGFDKGVHRKLFVTLNLNLLFNNIDNLESNVSQVFQGVNQVLDKSQNTHYEKFIIMLDTCSQVKNHISLINKNRFEIKRLINQYENLIERSLKTERIIDEKISNLRKPEKFSSEIDFVTERNKLDNKIINIKEIRGKAMEKLAVLRDKDSNISLTVDKILFDNIIMLNNITNNLKALESK